MPEIRHYVVTQTREVKVWANKPADAATIADAAFDGVAVTSVEGGVESEIRETAMTVEEDR